MNSFDGLYSYEIVLLLAGVLLFSALLVILVATFLRNRPQESKISNTSLIALFVLSVVMMGYPGIQKFSYENGKINLEKTIHQVESKPNDPAVKQELQATVDKLDGRTSDPKRLLTIARAYRILGKDDKATLLVNSSLKEMPNNLEAQQFKSQLLNRSMMPQRSIASEGPVSVVGTK